MNVTEISAGQFQEMVQAGATRLHTNAEYVNSLNVFPVPDGDTGTNMNLSMTSGAKAVADSRSEKVGELAGALSKGLLMVLVETLGLFYLNYSAASQNKFLRLQH